MCLAFIKETMSTSLSHSFFCCSYFVYLFHVQLLLGETHLRPQGILLISRYCICILLICQHCICYFFFYSILTPKKGAMFIGASYEIGRERSQSLEIAVCNTSVSNSSWETGKIKRRKYGRNRKRGETKTLDWKGAKWS